MALSFFKKELKDLNDVSPGRAAQRASRLDTASLNTWMDNTIMSLGASFDAWRYKDAPMSEVRDCVDALQVIWTELEKRKTA